MKITDVLRFYPRRKIFRFLVGALDRTTRMIVHTEHEDKISEFRYVMD